MASSNPTESGAIEQFGIGQGEIGGVIYVDNNGVVIKTGSIGSMGMGMGAIGESSDVNAGSSTALDIFKTSGAIGLMAIGQGGIGVYPSLPIPLNPTKTIPTIVDIYINTPSSNMVLDYFKKLIPRNWFDSSATLRDVLLGSLADLGAWLLSFIDVATAQTRIRTAQGWLLDMIGLDYLGTRMLRKVQESDASWRERIIFEILRERVTRKGITIALTQLTGQIPLIYEPWNGQDEGGGYGTGSDAYGGKNVAGPTSGYGFAGSGYGIAPSELGYGYIPAGMTSGFGGAGYYASLNYPYQIFITAYRPAVTYFGIPAISGYGNPGSGYGIIGDYADLSQDSGVVEDADIYKCVAETVAAGITAWVAIEDAPTGFDANFDQNFGRTNAS